MGIITLALSLQRPINCYKKSNNNETNGILLGPELDRIISDLLLTTIDINIDIQNKLNHLKHRADYDI